MSGHSGNKKADKCGSAPRCGPAKVEKCGSTHPAKVEKKCVSTPKTDPSPVHGSSHHHGNNDHCKTTAHRTNKNDHHAGGGHIEAGSFQGVVIWTESKESLPLYEALLKLAPHEFHSFKEALELIDGGLPPPDNPIIHSLLKIASFEKLKSVVKSIADQCSVTNSPQIVQADDFKDLFPMLKVVMNFSPNELESFKEAVNHYITRSQLMNNVVVRKFLEAAPNNKFEAVLAGPAADRENLFSSLETEKYFKGLTPMVEAILNMPANEFSTLKKVLNNHEAGSPLPDIPVVHKIRKVARHSRGP